MGETFDDAGVPTAPSALTYGEHLVVLFECDRPLAGAARYSLQGIDQVLIGRGGDRSIDRRDNRGIRTLEVRLPGRSVSDRHAKLIRLRDGWALEDAGSKNGTFVNGVRVERATLGQGDLFDLGHTFLRVNLSLATATNAAPDLDLGATSTACLTLDPSLADRVAMATSLARSEVPIFVRGESGTGKEVLARFIHARSEREGEFIAINCGALPSGLLESQLFGHVKGAFSGATRDEIGFFRAAHEGTLFLDEIADLPKGSQAALLRALQERAVVPVGATRPIAVDVRVIAATHESLDLLVAQDAFRRDLMARLLGWTVELPPLRERKDDLGLVIGALLARIAPDKASNFVLTPDVIRAFFFYDWPHNIRELEHCLRVCAALSPAGVIELQHIPPKITNAVRPRDSSFDVLSERDRALRMDLMARLSRSRGNLAEVARNMGKARMQIHRWCRRFGIDPNLYRE
jgi:transcriptional regulator with PAS, ATPase and Fis domain